jgi:hypothetical protein
VVPRATARHIDALVGTQLRGVHQALLVRQASHIHGVGASAHAAGQPTRERLYGPALGLRLAWALVATDHHITCATECAAEELQLRFHYQRDGEKRENGQQGDVSADVVHVYLTSKMLSSSNLLDSNSRRPSTAESAC